MKSQLPHAALKFDNWITCDKSRQCRNTIPMTRQQLVEQLQQAFYAGYSAGESKLLRNMNAPESNKQLNQLT